MFISFDIQGVMLIVAWLIGESFAVGMNQRAVDGRRLRLIVKNAVLWVMFLAYLGASVFFSFDSHFNAIFPADARKRAAEICTTSQIGVVVDIGALNANRQIEEADRLFDTEGWKGAYDRQLASRTHAAQGAQAEIEAPPRHRPVAGAHRHRAERQSRLAGKKISSTEELSRLKAERPGLAAEYGQHQRELDAKAKKIDAKRVEGMAEDRGVVGTLKQGKGPVYRQPMASSPPCRTSTRSSRSTPGARRRRTDTRKETPCQAAGIGKGGRCRNHGGMSTGPRTPEGRERCRIAALKRWDRDPNRRRVARASWATSTTLV